MLHDIEINWPFALLGEATIERDDDPPGLLAYHAGGFTYLRQPLDIFRSFILYHLWSKRCRKHFGDQYSLKKVLTQAWVATVEVGMASWKAIGSHRPTKDLAIQASIEINFRKEWLHMNIFGEDNATIRWHFLPPLYFLHFSNDWWGCCLPPRKGFTLRRDLQLWFEGIGWCSGHNSCDLEGRLGEVETGFKSCPWPKHWGLERTKNPGLWLSMQ